MVSAQEPGATLDNFRHFTQHIAFVSYSLSFETLEPNLPGLPG